MRNRDLQSSAQPAPVRYPDWLPRLEHAIALARSLPFVWGAHDCCLFPCDAVKAMTGVDLAAGFRGRYRSARRALRILIPAGGVEGLALSIAARYRIGEVAPGLARRGDVVLLEAESLGRTSSGVAFQLGEGGLASLAIVGLSGTHALAAGGEGLVEVPMPFWRRAWRIC